MSTEFIEQTNPVVENTTQLTVTETVENGEKLVARPNLTHEDPYPDKTPTQILEREYLLGSGVLAQDQMEIVFPHRLWLSHPTVVNYLRAFRYVRCGLKIRIQLITNPLHYGFLGVSALPYTNSLTEWISIEQQSQADMALMDISTQESYELSLPYIRPHNYFDRTINDDISWRVIMKVLHLGSLNSTLALGLRYNLFISAVDVETAGYVPMAEFQSMNPYLNRDVATRIAMGSTMVGTFATTLATTYGNQMIKGIETRGNKLAAWASDTTLGFVDDLFSPTETGKVVQHGGVQTNQAPVENAKLDVFGEIATPNLSVMTTTTRLGDGLAHCGEGLPQIKNLHRLGDISSVPTFLQAKLFKEAAVDIMDISCTPFFKNSHARYLSKMFRFYRGGSKILLKFACSQLVSSRFRITLFPVSNPSSIQTFGDLPTWTISVRGAMEWGIEVPYLANTPWSYTDVVPPATLRVELLQNIDQPFDVPAAVYVAAFGCASQDMQLCGLQSFVPSTLQGLFEEMSLCTPIGQQTPSNYQGGLSSIYQILTRFSSRDTTPDLLYPFPIKITNAVSASRFDNYDYVAALYGFYTGESRVKLAFSKANADGLIQATIRNSKASIGGDDFKGGNGLVVTQQGLWPVLEFTFPYQSLYPYDSVNIPNGMFPQFIGNEAKISKLLISCADSFRLMFLMPVPDFSLEVAVLQSAPVFLGDCVNVRQLRRDRLGTVDPGEVVAFQSLGPVLIQELNSYVRRTLPPATTADSVQILSGTAIQDKEIETTVTLSVVTTVTENIHFGLVFSHLTGTNALSPFTVYGGSPVFGGVLTQKDTAYNFTWNFCSYSIQSEIYAHFLKFGPSSGSLTYSLTFSTRRFGATVAGLNPVDTLVRTQLHPSSQISVAGPIVVSQPVAVEFITTPSVSVVNPVALVQPIEVLVNQPVTLAQPVATTVDFSTSGPIAVVGALNPAHPVYVSSYPDVT